MVSKMAIPEQQYQSFPVWGYVLVGLVVVYHINFRIVRYSNKYKSPINVDNDDNDDKYHHW